MHDFHKNPDYIRQRRSIIRIHHPDAGGSERELIHALTELEESWEKQQTKNPDPSFIEVASEKIADIALRHTPRRIKNLVEEFRRGYNEEK